MTVPVVTADAELQEINPSPLTSAACLKVMHWHVYSPHIDHWHSLTVKHSHPFDLMSSSAEAYPSGGVNVEGNRDSGRLRVFIHHTQVVCTLLQQKEKLKDTVPGTVVEWGDNGVHLP